MHVSVYSKSGNTLFDKKVSADNLPAHLEDIGPLGSHASDPNAPQYRLYFASHCDTDDLMCRRYMRQFLWHYQAVADAALAFSSGRLDVGFHAYTEEVQRAPNGPPARILHCWLKCTTQLMAEDLNADLELFSKDMQEFRLRHKQQLANRRYTAVQNPALYMIYDYESRQCVLVCTEYTTLFRALQQTCQDAEALQLGEDPFVFWAVFLKRILNPTRRTAIAWRRELLHISDDLMDRARDKNDLFERLAKFTNDRIAYGTVAEAMQGIVRDIDRISKEHGRMRGTQDPVYDSIERCLEGQHAVAQHLAMLFRDCAEMAQSFTDVILGYSQLKNSFNTEDLAVDAKRDTQTMKTITYVTLVFLPSTFVSTVFSMQIFDFNTDKGKDGHVTISNHGWVFLAVALPLTLVTLAIAYLWMRIKADTSRPKPDDDETARHKELANSSFRVVHQRGSKGTRRRVAMSELPRKDIVALLAELKQRVDPAAAVSPQKSSGQYKVQAAVKRRRGGFPDEIEEIPLDQAPPGCLELLISELEETLRTRPPEDGSTLRDRWQQRLFRPRRGPAVGNDSGTSASAPKMQGWDAGKDETVRIRVTSGGRPNDARVGPRA